jgi:hypothetical protein
MKKHLVKKAKKFVTEKKPAKPRAKTPAKRRAAR